MSHDKSTRERWTLLESLEKTLRSNVPELERQFYRTRERWGINSYSVMR